MHVGIWHQRRPVDVYVAVLIHEQPRRGRHGKPHCQVKEILDRVDAWGVADSHSQHMERNVSQEAILDPYGATRSTNTFHMATSTKSSGSWADLVSQR